MTVPPASTTTSGRRPPSSGNSYSNTTDHSSASPSTIAAARKASLNAACASVQATSWDDECPCVSSRRWCAASDASQTSGGVDRKVRTLPAQPQVSAVMVVTQYAALWCSLPRPASLETNELTDRAAPLVGEGLV